MFKLKVEQANYNNTYFNFNDVDSAAMFIKMCMKHDDGETSYTLTYQPEEKEGE